MMLIERIADLRGVLERERARGRSIGFVPTMGALHDGHASLVRRARAECERVLVSIFVNPTQFGSGEDLDGYPRDLEPDLAICEAEGADLVFHPPVEEMYPEGTGTGIGVSAGPIAGRLCGRARPGHFDGVATVVTKLFSIAGPCRAYFGEKDYQQLLIIRRVARALDLPVRVVGCPTVRDPDGLALSSRNRYLSAEERRAALAVPRALVEGAAAVAAGERAAPRVAARMAAAVSSEPLARLDYAACVDPETLEDAARIEAPVRLAVAAWVGRARLIDNTTATPPAAVAPAARGPAIRASAVPTRAARATGATIGGDR